jgi:hypothetical protein
MRRIVLIILAGLCTAGPIRADRTGEEEQMVRFAPLNVYIDSGAEQLAAYQFELKTTAGEVRIVGIEGGEHPAFAEPPYYDPAALMQDRVIIAAFNTGDDLPTGKTRVTTIHLQIIGDTDPEYELQLTVAGTYDGRQIPAVITFEKGEQK